MAQTYDLEFFDKRVRLYIYEHFVRIRQAPTLLQCAHALATSLPAVQDACRRLAEGRALVLQSNGEILMAEPFSAVPTAFYVEVGTSAWWGNCIWDALGIPAMLKADARIVTACGCCNDAMTIEISKGSLINPSGIVHFAIPPRDWWKDVVFA
ncbi:MAG TPA: organomercurial lyase [Ktedonosporobacter sp.]|nr:organomercurial lyase [Ktedonosporobacter sp.]